MSTKLKEQEAAAAKNNDEEDEDSEDDDYVPEEDMDEDDEGDASADVNIMGSHLSASKRKAVDETFENLFGYPFGTTFCNKKRRTSNNNMAVSKQESLLQQIFGPSVAAHLMATSKSVRAMEVNHVKLPLTVQQTVTEVKRFAGQDVTVEKKISVSTATSSDAAATTATADFTSNVAATMKQPPAAPSASSGLDGVLAEIAGPSKLSTVAKTSADWDSFKTKTGVEQELEKQAQSNKAFLVKQDFLKRVDERRFEHERSQREKERAARNK